MSINALELQSRSTATSIYSERNLIATPNFGIPANQQPSEVFETRREAGREMELASGT